MMRSPLAVLWLASCLWGSAGSVAGDIVAVELADDGVPTKIKRRAVVLDGVEVLIGEPRDYISLDPSEWSEDWVLRLLLLDPGEPGFVPYRVGDEGERRLRNKRWALEIPGEHVRGVRVLAPRETIQSLASEHALRIERTGALRTQWKRARRGSAERGELQARLAEVLRQDVFWLERNGFVTAAESLRAELQELEQAAVDPDDRLARALASIQRRPIPNDLRRASEDISGGADEFRVQESTHVRIVYLSDLRDERIAQALALAETLIEHFRRDYLDGRPASLPDRVLSELWFGPEERRKFEFYFEDYYGLWWGEGRERETLLGWSGKYARLENPVRFLTYLKLTPRTDVEGNVAHLLGHDLVRLAFERDPRGGAVHQNWLREGFGVLLSLRYLGRNTVSCGSFSGASRTGERVPRRRDPYESQRAYYQALARESERTLDRLLVASLIELDAFDVAKSWSLVEFLSAVEAFDGIELMRSISAAAHDKSTFRARWRESAARLLDVPDPDLVGELERAWREGRSE